MRISIVVVNAQKCFKLLSARACSNKTEVGRRLALALLHVQYARQWPAGGLNDSVYVNWRGPLPTAIEARGDGTLQVLLDTLDGAGVFLNDTHDCWECCAKARDTFQVYL